MTTILERDGTPIAFERTGNGAPLILVDGAPRFRASGPSGPLAALVAPHFTVFTYDRRGQGESGDTGPYAIEREVEDIEALLREAGGWAFVYGISSGAALALEAANRLSGIRKLACYEAPFIVDDTHSPLPEEYLPQLAGMIASDRRSHAVKFFMRRVGVPGIFVALMPLMPVWSKLKSVAHTSVYDITLVKTTSGASRCRRSSFATERSAWTGENEHAAIRSSNCLRLEEETVGRTADCAHRDDPADLRAVIGITIWAGLYLRDHRMGALVPLRREV